MEPDTDLCALVEVKFIGGGSTESVYIGRVVVETADLEYYSDNHYLCFGEIPCDRIACDRRACGQNPYDRRSM